MPTKTRSKRPLSEKQLAHIEDLKRMNAERRGVPAPTAVAERPSDVASDEADILHQLGQALLAEGQTRTEQNKKLEQLDALLGTLSTDDYPALMKNPAIQQFIELMGAKIAERHPDDPPGTIYHRGMLNESKKPWQMRDLPRAFPDPTCRRLGRECPNCGGAGACAEMVEITPNETNILTWQGLSWPIVADTQQWIPRPHYDVYRETLRGRETARQHAQMMFRQRDQITGNADASVVNASTARIRGLGVGTQGYRPGAGGFNPYEGAEEGES